MDDSRAVDGPACLTIEENGQMDKFQCISDRYDRSGGVYDSAEDFARMCFACFGEEPALTWSDDGYRDENGELVLVKVES